MGYILGFDGRCCNSCAPANACAQKPVTNTTSVSQSIGPVTAGAYITPVIATSGWPWFGASSFSATGLPSGMSISSGGTVSGYAPTSEGYYTFYVTASNACGSGTAALWLIVGESGGCTWLGPTTSPTCGFDNTYDVTGYFLDSFNITVTLTGGQCYPLVGPYVCTDSASRVKVWANSVLIFDTGCITGNGSWPVTVPSGTTSLRCYSECECDFTCESGCGTTSAVSFLCPL